MTIPNIPVVGGEGIPLIQVNGTGIQFVQNIRPTNTTINPIGVGIAIYYIFMYDTWYPNDGTEHGHQDSSLGSEGRSYDGSYEGTHP